MTNEQIIEKLKDFIEKKYGMIGRAGIVLYEDTKHNSIQLLTAFSLDMELLCKLTDKYKKLKGE